MSKKYIFLYVIAALLVVIIVGVLLGVGLMKNKYKSLVMKYLKQETSNGKEDVLTEDDIKSLPEPVKKYIRYTGSIGKPKVYNIRMTFNGKMKLSGEKSSWVNVNVQQYDFLDTKARLFYIGTNMFGVPVKGIDSYVDGNGNMLIKVGGLFKVADAKGNEMNISETTTLLNDMCIAAPASLIDSRIKWESIDEHSAKCTFEDKNNKVSAVLYFNDLGQLINYVTEDRYYALSDNTYEKVKWSTPLKDYKMVNGIRLAGYGEGVWHFNDRDFCYAKYNIESVEYNCRKFK